VSSKPAAESEQQLAAVVTATVSVEQQKIGLHLLLQQLGCLWCCLQWHSPGGAPCHDHCCQMQRLLHGLQPLKVWSVGVFLFR